MEQERLFSLLDGVSVAVGDPHFLDQLFTALTRDLKQRARESDGSIDPIEKIVIQEYDGLSRRLDATSLQESCVVRNNLKSRRLAQLLIDDEGKLDRESLQRAVQLLRRHLYPLGPARHHDYRRNEHMLDTLEKLSQEPALQRALGNIDKPFANPVADALIRDTLQMEEHEAVKVAHARRAVLAAWLCYLRQNVGSCFATAPAILIQQEQPLQFLRDLRDLFGTGRMSRVFEGTEYSVPLSASWGAGDLRRPFVYHPDPDQARTPIWEAPGMIVALTRAEVLDAADPLPKRITHCRELLKALYENDPEVTGAFLTEAETVLRKLLLRHLGLTEDDLEEYAARPRAMVHGGLLLQGSGDGGLGKQVKTFETALDVAYKSFKSLTDNALLRAWEFSLASFAEVKPSLSRYNMYHSLGLAAEDEAGIGGVLYATLKEKVDLLNQETEEYQEAYEQMYMQVKHLEGRMRRAGQEEAAHLKSQYRNRVRELDYQQQLRDLSHDKARRFANLFNLLIDLYDSKFVEYFQEVYDPDIREVTIGPYDDTPAGFRLLYKAGRSLTSQWERIDSPNAFSEALASFFIATERDIATSQECEGIEDEVSAVITGLVSHVKTDLFLESALTRMAIAHNERPIKEPLKHMDKVSKKPWVYTSGGTMGSLVAAYFSRPEKPTEQERWVENETELLVFLLDTLKQLPPGPARTLDDQRHRYFLMHSPTHAFLLKPKNPLFSKGWQSEEYTYTWVKDEVVVPQETMLLKQRLDDAMIAKILQLLRDTLPTEYHHFFNKAFYRVPRTALSTDLRQFIVHTVERDRALQSVLTGDDVDHMLYRQLPLIRGYELRDRIEETLESVLDYDAQEISRFMDLYDTIVSRQGKEEVLGAEQLRELIQALVMLFLEATSAADPIVRKMVAIMRKRGWMLPAPIVFADSNWMKDDFAFVVSPGTGQLELWRVDPLALSGTPMRAWKAWVDGSRRDRKWGVYTNPYEYHTEW